MRDKQIWRCLHVHTHPYTHIAPPPLRIHAHTHRISRGLQRHRECERRERVEQDAPAGGGVWSRILLMHHCRRVARSSGRPVVCQCLVCTSHCMHEYAPQRACVLACTAACVCMHAARAGHIPIQAGGHTDAGKGLS